MGFAINKKIADKKTASSAKTNVQAGVVQNSSQRQVPNLLVQVKNQLKQADQEAVDAPGYIDRTV